MSYAAASDWVGAAKSTVCRWLKREPLNQPTLAGRVLEMDGLWTRAAAGRVEMKVIRDDKGVALATFAGWERAIDQAWQNGATEPVHVVSDGDRAIAAGLALVYGREVPHQLCQLRSTGATWVGTAGGKRGGCWRRLAWRKRSSGRGG